VSVLDSTGLAALSSVPRASALLACPDSCASEVSRNDERREDGEDDQGDWGDRHNQSLALEDGARLVRAVVRYAATFDDLRWRRGHYCIVTCTRRGVVDQFAKHTDGTRAAHVTAVPNGGPNREEVPC
jgi:hypothetical protein